MADSTEYLREIQQSIKQLAQAIVDEMIARGIGIGGGGSADGDANSANQTVAIERITQVRDRLPSSGIFDAATIPDLSATKIQLEAIKSNIGAVEDVTAQSYEMGDAYSSGTPKSLISLARGILQSCSVLPSLSHSVNEITSAINSLRLGLQDILIDTFNFGTVVKTKPVASPFRGRSGITSVDPSYLLLDNNYSRTYLLVQNKSNSSFTIEFDTSPPTNIVLRAGETFTMEGTSVASNKITLIQSASGQEYTALELGY